MMDPEGKGLATHSAVMVKVENDAKLMAFFTMLATGGGPPCGNTGMSRRLVWKFLRALDTGGTGSLSWAQFVDFVRSEGMLLEYKAYTSRNMDSQRHSTAPPRKRNYCPKPPRRR